MIGFVLFGWGCLSMTMQFNELIHEVNKGFLHIMLVDANITIFL